MRARLRLVVCVLGVVVAVPAGPAPAASAQSDGSATRLPPRALLTAPPEVRLIAQNGFGDPRNVYAWSMARFRGRIYVGTGRLIACVENITIDFYLRVSQRYITDPLPAATCPPDPYDMDLRSEIWEYTLRTGKWLRVYRSRADVPNPRAPGRFVARDIAFRGMTVFRDARGRKRLYAGGVTANEYLPELRRKYPPRILSSRDGRHWRATPARNVLVRVPYGVFRPIGFRSLHVWRGRMYVTATPGLTGDGAIFEVERPWSPQGVRFRQITPRTMAVFEFDRFNGALYAGTGDRARGYGVYRIARDSRSRYRVEPIVTDGAGRGQTVTSVVAMHVFEGRLYVGSSGWYNEESNPVSEIIRIDRAGGWQVVAGPPRTVRGQLVGPISGLGDGFNNVFAAHFWRMTTYRGELVVGTNDWAYLTVVAYPGLAPWAVDLIELVLKGEMGFDLWASCDGVNWRAITRNAFGGSRYDFGARNLVAADGRLFVGSANHAQGTNVWRYRGSNCQATTSDATASAKPRPRIPQALMTDVQQEGTVLSWRSTAAAGTRYRVMRATYTDVPLRLSRPEVMPSGFPLEGSLPRVGGPGAKGSKAAGLPMTSGFTTIGTTRGRFFVDRTARRGVRYGYQVVAETPSGARSAASNVQVVPDPRPAPEFGAAGVRGASATMSRVTRDAAARRAMLHRLARLRRAARPGSDRRLLLERLERRVRYAGIAGNR